eukprot:TRINITY_DN2713_c0_g1_i1.p1 TRINITY_DN2713_c0_g1~~TRINITY_DN2713_c0_g1_i1.p1  ORF type:complete len:515 (+),score=203.18 TRINITY_DN2713_c0_g1_i1:64-1608(+)
MTTSGFANVERQGSVGGQLDYTDTVHALRQEFASGKTKSVAWRRRQLERIQQMFEECHEQISEAVRKDHGGPKLRGFFELGAHAAAQFALANLDQWAEPETVPTPFEVSLTRMGKSYIRKEPKGVVLIIAPWNFPFELGLHPLVSAVAAGNCVVIKPSEVSQHSAVLMQQLIEKYMDTTCIKVVQGAVAETTALLKQRWDHIFYTGNGHVGKIILRAASEHLTPVTLELGGKSPVIIDKSAKLDTAVARVSAIKWLNAGQICVAPDYVLVHKDVEKEFAAKMAKQIKASFGGDVAKSGDFGRIINANHVNRIGKLVQQTGGTVAAGGADRADPAKHYFPPTLVRGPRFDEPLMKEEIFGPVLPIVPVASIDEAIQRVNAVCDRPLALYVFAEDKQVVQKVLDATTSGGVAVNTALEHLGNVHLPFGGVGGSGYGSYHGKAGFDEFTHRRSCFQQDTTFMKGAIVPMAPFNDKIYDLAVKAKVTGFLSKEQRQMAKMVVGGAAAVGAGVLLRSRL